MILEETYKTKATNIIDKMPECACVYVVKLLKSMFPNMMFDNSPLFKTKFKNLISNSSEEWCKRFVESYESTLF